MIIIGIMKEYDEIVYIIVENKNLNNVIGPLIRALLCGVQTWS